MTGHVPRRWLCAIVAGHFSEGVEIADIVEEIEDGVKISRSVSALGNVLLIYTLYKGATGRRTRSVGDFTSGVGLGGRWALDQ